MTEKNLKAGIALTNNSLLANYFLDGYVQKDDVLGEGGAFGGGEFIAKPVRKE